MIHWKQDLLISVPPSSLLITCTRILVQLQTINSSNQLRTPRVLYTDIQTNMNTSKSRWRTSFGGSGQAIDPELKLQRTDFKKWRRKHNKREEHVLHFACAKNHMALLEHALQEHAGGASLPTRDWEGRSALRIGAAKGHSQCMKLFLEQGHRCHLKEVVAAVAVAVEQNDVEMLNLLLDSEVAGESVLQITALDNVQSAIRIAFRLRQYVSVLDLFGFFKQVVERNQIDPYVIVLPTYANEASALLYDILNDPKAVRHALKNLYTPH